MNKIVKTTGIIFLCVFASSCYTYGPIHDPYYQAAIVSPPVQVPKVFASPLTRSEYMNKTYRELKEALPEADIKLVEDSIKVLFPNNIQYEKSALYPSTDYESPLIVFSSLLHKYFKTEILITGHTDNRGKKEKNRELSTLRAQYILNFLFDHGIARNRLQSIGLGDISPVADNNSDDGRSRNRRVEFVVLYQAG